MLISLSPSQTIAVQKANNEDLILNKTQQANVGKYIRDCEVEKAQSNFYENESLLCFQELENRPDRVTRWLEYGMVFLIGYAVGVVK